MTNIETIHLEKIKAIYKLLSMMEDANVFDWDKKPLIRKDLKTDLVHDRLVTKTWEISAMLLSRKRREVVQQIFRVRLTPELAVTIRRIEYIPNEVDYLIETHVGSISKGKIHLEKLKVISDLGHKAHLEYDEYVNKILRILDKFVVEYAPEIMGCISELDSNATLLHRGMLHVDDLNDALDTLNL